VIDLLVEGGEVVVRLSGWDRVFALRREVRAPLASVTDVAHDQHIARNPKAPKWPGTRWPGKIYAGTWLHPDGRWFWCVRDPARAVRVDFADQPFRRWVVSVDDPPAAVRAIRRAARLDPF
jgi:hypothetical protein